MSGRLYLLPAYGIALLCFCLSACATRETYYSHFEPMEDALWRADQEVFFSFPKPSMTTTSTMSVTLVLRVEKGIRLPEVPVGLTLEYPSHEYQTLQVQIPLREQAQKGYHLSEVVYELPVFLQCEEEGIYTISLRHLATQPEIRGIVELGVLVSLAPKEARER